MAKARAEGSGYERVLGDAKLGQLVSATHATTISAGTELEKLIAEQANKLSDLDRFLQATPYPHGTFLATKTQVRTSNVIGGTSKDPDFVIFDVRPNTQRCLVVELKEGDQFDTKKAAGEWEALEHFVTAVARQIQFTVSPHVCFFYATDRQQVVDGFKRVLGAADALTGREFCDLLGVNYDDIVEYRRNHQRENFAFFLETLFRIPSVRTFIRRKRQENLEP